MPMLPRLGDPICHCPPPWSCSHAGAPPYQVYVLPLGLEKTVFAGTTTIFFAFVNAVKLVPY